LNIVEPDLLHDLHADTLILFAFSSEERFQAERFIVGAFKRLIPYSDSATTAAIKRPEDDLNELDVSQKEDAPFDLSNYHIMPKTSESL